MGRGRKPKEKLSIREQEDNVIYKYMHGEPMTLEESALALHMADKAAGRPSKKPMTRMGFLKFEARVLEKLRKACEDRGFTRKEAMEILSTMGNRQRRVATGNYSNSIDSD